MKEISIKTRRAELLVEGFLDALAPLHFVEVAGDSLGYNFMVAFKKPDGGLKHCAIDVKQTDSILTGDFCFNSGRRFLELMKSDIPTAIVIADTKRNQLYYGFASEARIVNEAS